MGAHSDTIEVGAQNGTSDGWLFEGWQTLVVGGMALVMLAATMADFWGQLSVRATAVTAALALIVGCLAPLAPSKRLRAVVLLALMLLGAGVLVHAYDEEALGSVWFGTVIAGACAGPVVVARLRGNRP